MDSTQLIELAKNLWLPISLMAIWIFWLQRQLDKKDAQIVDIINRFIILAQQSTTVHTEAITLMKSMSNSLQETQRQIAEVLQEVRYLKK